MKVYLFIDFEVTTYNIKSFNSDIQFFMNKWKKWNNKFDIFPADIWTPGSEQNQVQNRLILAFPMFNWKSNFGLMKKMNHWKGINQQHVQKRFKNLVKLPVGQFQSLVRWSLVHPYSYGQGPHYREAEFHLKAKKDNLSVNFLNLIKKS